MFCHKKRKKEARQRYPPKRKGGTTKKGKHFFFLPQKKALLPIPLSPDRFLSRNRNTALNEKPGRLVDQAERETPPIDREVAARSSSGRINNAQSAPATPLSPPPIQPPRQSDSRETIRAQELASMMPRISGNLCPRPPPPAP